MKMACFVLMDFSPEYRVVFEKAIRPAAEEEGLSCIRADDLQATHDILGQVFAKLRESAVVIADMTGGNPNVAYEVGVAQSLGRKIILTTQSVEEVPFDFRNQKVIAYSADGDGLQHFRAKLREEINLLLHSPKALLARMITPHDNISPDDPFVIVANPLTYQGKKGSRPTLKFDELGTFSEYLGIIGLIRAFGIVFGLGRTPDLINPRDFAEESVGTHPVNLYLLGSPKSNYWTKLVLDSMCNDWRPCWEFRVDPESPDMRDPWGMLQKDGNPYEAAGTSRERRREYDFGLIVRAPHPKSARHIVMVLAGRTGLGTAAACYAATTPDHIISLGQELQIDIEDPTQAFWAIATARRAEGKRRKVDTRSVEIVEAQHFVRKA